MVKKHVKPNSKNTQGGIEEKEAPIHISNVTLLNENINEGRANKDKKVNPKKSK